MKKIIVGMLVVTVALVVGFSAATTEAWPGGKHGKHGWHHGHGHHWHHGHGSWYWNQGPVIHYGYYEFVAEATNARGAWYVGRSSSAQIAKRRAMRKCFNDSFAPGTCRVVSVKRVWVR
jgi:hypothetical protein